jgi:hypothetical protein
VVLALPAPLNARKVSLDTGGASRVVWVKPGEREIVRVPVAGYPVPVLHIRADRADYIDEGTPNARLAAIRIPSISYVSEGRN